MRLSVIVPVYNVESYVGKCVESLANQTYKDMEIIFVNDGSTDSSRKIIEDTILQYNLMNCIIVDKENAGLPQARKTGLSKAKGQYVAFIDSDDWVDADYFEKCMGKVSDEVDILDTGFCDECSDGRSIVHGINGKELVVAGIEAIRMIHNRKQLEHGLCNKIIKRSLFDKVAFPKGNFVGEDYIITMQLLRSVNRFKIISEPGYHYRLTTVSMSRDGFGSSKRKGFFAFYMMYDRVKRWYSDVSVEIDNFYTTEYLAVIVSMARNMKTDAAILRFTRGFVKKHIKQYVRAQSVDFMYKCSAIMFCFNTRLFLMLYHLYSKSVSA